MMTSKTRREAFVWVWLHDETSPVVAGRLEADISSGRRSIFFNYGKSYLERVNDSKPAMSIYEPELPLQAGVLPLTPGLVMPGCIRDAAPDAWGRRVIINKILGLKGSASHARTGSGTVPWQLYRRCTAQSPDSGARQKVHRQILIQHGSL